MAYFVYFLLMNDIFWICVHVPLVTYLLRVPHLCDLFSTFWRLILYTYHRTLIYSLEVSHLADLVCKLIFLAYFVYFSIVSLSSWPSYTLVTFMAYLFKYSSLVSLSLHHRYFMATCVRTTGDLFCKNTSSCWPILFIRKLFDGLFNTQTAPYWTIFHK